MGTLYIQTTGNAANSGSSDNNAADLSGTTATFISTTVVQLDSGTVLTGITTSGANQSAINIAGATNANRTVFWITAVSGSGGATPQVTLDVAPTGMTTNSWRIGGRMVYTSANLEGALRAGDVLQFNDTPASKASSFLTARTSGDTTSGQISVIGKAGASVTLQATGNFGTIIGNSQTNWTVSNLTLTSAGNVPTIQNASSGWIIDNIKVTQTGSVDGVTFAASGFSITNSDITSTAGNGISNSINTGMGYIGGNYVHGCGAVGILASGVTPSLTIDGNLITGNTGRGIYLSGASTTQASRTSIIGNTIYGNANSGIEVLDADTVVTIRNNIVVATSTTVATVKWAAGTGQFVSQHAYNVFWNSADSNSGLSGVTINSTESASDPLFSNAGSGNFAIGNSSPAAATGWPGAPLNSSSVGYKDMGALQRVVSSSGGGVIGS